MKSSDLETLENNLKAWDEKPELRASYERYYKIILSYCEKQHIILELGAGFGAFSDYARKAGFASWFSCDVLPSRFSDFAADAGAIPLRNQCVERIVFVDVMHHLEYPMRMFSEAARVLKPGGQIICVEPWISFFSWFVYRYLHHEGADLSRDPENPFQGGGKDAYQGCASLATVIVRKTSAPQWKGLGFSSPHVLLINDLSYLLTGGFSAFNLCPSRVIQLVRRGIDNRLRFMSPVICMRALLKWVLIK